MSRSIPPPSFTDQAEAHKNQGNFFLQRGLLDQAAQEYLRALELRPDHHIALSNLGIVLQAQGRLSEAMERFNQALALEPQFTAALSNLSVVLHRLGRFEEAETRLLKALALEPDYPEARSNLGNVYLAQGRWEEAVRQYQWALRHKPDYPDALTNLGVALQHQGHLSESAHCLEHALRLDPHSHETWTNLGVVRHRQGSLDAALACLARALQLKPDHPEALANQGCLLVELGKFTEALAQFTEALKLAPDLAEAHFAESLVLLLLGDFASGWKKHEWRWRRTGFRGHGRKEPLWDGQPLHGRSILLHCEQGMGDSIQFIRFAREVKAKGGHVVLKSPPSLHRLFQTARGIDLWVTDDTRIPLCQFQAPLMSLPHLLGITLDHFPTPIPYLAAPDPSPLPQHETWKSTLRVGLVWRGNSAFRDDFKRSMDPTLLEPLLEIPGITFIGLQVSPRHGDLDVCNRYPNFFDASGLLTDFAATAAVVANLDLVIAVDTAVLHLAGALGRPAWALLPQTPDWRWLLGRTDSPWYPTIQLFRQNHRGNWLEVISRVATQLRTWMAKPHGPECKT
ncbi:MAG: TPR REGION protein [Magnetococcales bacterium]|nr:TPR REGION protein [Magnetococcales bacterium]HIJ85658.1 tetratricopeptide repeat protein [Magnetococcales bacterium]